MIIPQVFYNILLLASIPAAVAACIAGVFLLRKGWRAGAVLCGLVMLAGVLGFLLPLNGVLVGDGMVNGLSYQGKQTADCPAGGAAFGRDAQLAGTDQPPFPGGADGDQLLSRRPHRGAGAGRGRRPG